MFLFKETLRDLNPTQPDALVWNESSMLKERIEMFNRQMPAVLKRLTLEPLEPFSSRLSNEEPSPLGGFTGPWWKAELFLFLTHKFFQNKKLSFFQDQ